MLALPRAELSLSLFFFFFLSSFSRRLGKNGSSASAGFFFFSVSLFKDFWCLHALEKRLEIWQGWDIPDGNQPRFGQIVSLWEAWPCVPGLLLRVPTGGREAPGHDTEH